MRRPAPRLARIELRQASVRFGSHWALHHIDFELAAGERWLLLGGNGAGKTIFLKLLRGDVWPTPGEGTARRYHMADGDVLEHPLGASERIAYLGPERQDRYERLESTLDVTQVVHTGFDDSDFPLTPPSPGQRRRIQRVLQDVGLAGMAARRFRSLSYGQRRRALLARALVRRPDVLLLDEATNGLDAAARRAFLRALEVAVPARTAWVLSTHRTTEAPAGTTRVARLDAGHFVERTAFYGRRQAITPRSTTRTRRPGARSLTVRTPLALVRLERAAIYRDERPVIGTFDWALLPGEHWHVTGPNGAGKSTFIALLYGDLWPAHGGRLVRGAPGLHGVEDWKRGVGLVSPELQAAFAATACTVEEIVRSGLHSSIGLDREPTARERTTVRRELRAWQIDEWAERRARELSYGQLRLALAARACVRPRRLYLLDEPFDGLDARSARYLNVRIEEAVQRGATLVVATHHAGDVPACVRNQLHMRAGRAPLIRPGL